VTTVLVAVAADGAREEARRILAEPRFHERKAPQPFRGVLHWLGEQLSPLGRPFAWFLGLLPDWLLFVAAGGAVVLVALVATRVVRARGAAAVMGRRFDRATRAEDPDALERAAAEAERKGELERALRLRFRAGLLRLGRADAIPLRESLTSGEAARLLRNATFDLLAAEFDEVVYGGREAGVEHLERARAGWPDVLAAVTRA
jgi:hypothetical protein